MVDIDKHEFGRLMLSACKYALGRETHIVQWTCSTMWIHWTDITKGYQELIRRDIKAALDEAGMCNSPLGSAYDNEEWQHFLDLTEEV